MEFQLKFINVFNDINKENRSDIQNFYDSADLVLDKDLGVPDFKESSIINNLISKTLDIHPIDVRSHLLNEYVGLDEEIVEAIYKTIISDLEMLVPNKNSLKSGYSKILYWLKTYFKPVMNNKTSTVYVNFKITKYSLYALYLVSKLGNNIVIVDYNFNQNKELYKIYNNFNFHITNTSERLPLVKVVQTQPLAGQTHKLVGQTQAQVIHPTSQTQENLNLSLRDILKIMTGKLKIRVGKILVTGLDKEMELQATLVNIGKETPDNVLLLKDGIRSITFDETKEFQKLRPSNLDKNTLIMNCGKLFKQYKNEAEAFIKQEINRNDDYNQVEQKLFNLAAGVNRYDLNKSMYIIYGAVNKTNITFINFLMTLTKVVIVIDVTGKSVKNIDNSWIKVEAGENVGMLPYPDKVVQTTIAYKASQEMNRTIFNGETVGLYRDRQFKTCKSVELHTTIDEVYLMWKEDNLVRPGFNSDSSGVTVPVFFTVFNGVNSTYMRDIRKLVTGHTLLCFGNKEIRDLVNPNGFTITGGTCMKGTLYNEQKPFVVNDELDYRLILNHRLFKYKVLSNDVKMHIMSKLSEMIKNPPLYYTYSHKNFIDEVLTVGLNFTEPIQELMTWYDYTKQAPKLVVICQDREQLDLQSLIILEVLHLCGWDIAIFIPTCYNLFSTNRKSKLQEFTLGEPKFDTNINYDSLKNFVEEPEQKEGFFKRLFK